MALPVRARLALLSGLLVAALLVGAGVFLFVRLEADLLEAVDESLRSRAATLAGKAILPFEGEELFAQRLERNGSVTESSPGLSGESLLSADAIARLRAPSFFDSEVRTSEEKVPARLLGVTEANGGVLVVGASLDDQREALGRLLALLGIGGPVAIALAGGVGWVVAGAALRPVERMRVEADAVSASEPGRRLPVAATRDELARLGESLNRMLGRLEHAAERERRFVDDAAHELRTPLANLRAELELALQRSRTPEALRGSLASAREETERLVRLAEDLLLLSRADRGRLPIRREEVEVSELLGEIVGGFTARASENGIRVGVSASGPVRARLDAARIRQAIGNLLDNALQHTPPGGRIAVTMTRGESTLAIEVSDTGEGFEASFLPRAFEPFGRADAGRSRDSGGAGLGLTIVRAVAEAHGGSAEARNLPKGGAAVTIRLHLEDLISGSRSSHDPAAMLSPSERKEEA